MLTCDCTNISKEEESNLCQTFISDGMGMKQMEVKFIDQNGFDSFLCSPRFQTHKICLWILAVKNNTETVNADEQSVEILTDTQFNVASNFCIEAVIANHQCPGYHLQHSQGGNVWTAPLYVEAHIKHYLWLS